MKFLMSQEDHYFSAIPERVMGFYQEVERELWALGIPMKTRIPLPLVLYSNDQGHTEVAPNQFEFAPIFEPSSVACDHNILMMDVMRSVARKHNFECLLHEKPFAGVNGSGKHQNWSCNTNEGENLFNPSAHPDKNINFQLFLASVLKAVDTHADLLRIAVTIPGNDHRLGANEAPPAILSVYLGEEIQNLFSTIVNGTPYVPIKHGVTETGVANVSRLPRDTSDRNRTSPFAFTGDKFEFRAVGSSQNISRPNYILNTAMAGALEEVGAELTAALKKTSSTRDAVAAVVKQTMKQHERIVYHGNGYTEEWVKEAAKRGLPNYRTAAEAMKHFVSAKNTALFSKTGVLSADELSSRGHIIEEHYVKV
jgi:glutamine synthetase